MWEVRSLVIGSSAHLVEWSRFSGDAPAICDLARGENIKYAVSFEWIKVETRVTEGSHKEGGAGVFLSDVTRVTWLQVTIGDSECCAEVVFAGGLIFLFGDEF